MLWQDSAALRALHVLPTGDVDPAWPAGGALVSGGDTPSMIGALPDGLGGLYAWWMRGSGVFATRLVGDGSVAPSWPANGQLLGQTWTVSPVATVIGDGSNGFYAAWVTQGHIRGVHLGPDNTGTAGWPTAGAQLTAPGLVSSGDFWPQLALASDGGVFLAYARASADSTVDPSTFRLQRITPAGAVADGWSPGGVSLGSFRFNLITEMAYPPFRTALVAVDADAGDGAYVFLAEAVDGAYLPYLLPARLHHVLGDGQVDPDWPVGGASYDFDPPGFWNGGPDASLRVFGDGQGAVVAQQHADVHGSSLVLRRCLTDGTCDYWQAWQAQLTGTEFVPRPEGGLYAASFVPDGPTSPYDDVAYMIVNTIFPGRNLFTEYHLEIAIRWYGDIALAGTGDGGAVFFWSQVYERFGIFARRFTPAGEVTDAVGGSPPADAFRLRHVRGEGVRAWVAGTGTRFDLFDVSGRRVAGLDLESPMEREFTVPGTSGLAAGLYFGRLVGAGRAHFARVSVVP